MERANLLIPGNINLSFDGVLKFLWEWGGRIDSPHHILFVKTIEKVIKLCTVLIFVLSGSFEDMGIFSRIYLSICYGSI